MKCAGVAVLEDGPERYPEEPAARIFAAMA
jgi:hypothetical protein